MKMITLPTLMFHLLLILAMPQAYYYYAAAVLSNKKRASDDKYKNFVEEVVEDNEHFSAPAELKLSLSLFMPTMLIAMEDLIIPNWYSFGEEEVLVMLSLSMSSMTMVSATR